MKINHDDIEEVLISADEIDARLDVLAREIDVHYEENAQSDGELVLVGILTGATIVMSDFSRKLETSSVIDWMSLSSYGSGTKSSGVVRVLKDLSTDIKGKNVLIVEDIIDSGVTLQWVVNDLKTRGAKSVEVVSLLNKQLNDSVSQKSRIVARWVGFNIPDKFVVGYGLDYAGKYRTLPYIGVLKSEVYS
ncbi:hypoxanthine phosphoribosyltransferase [Actinomycetota bacterium]|nr:hypoxanthine phosphoribosyltransferase [Actinomycetota bacterium]